jgi:hypothetical protein
MSPPPGLGRRPLADSSGDRGSRDGRAAYTLTVSGVPRIGSSMHFQVGGGPPGQSIFALGPMDGEVLLYPYGIVTAGRLESLFLWPYLIPTGQTLQIGLPNDPALIGSTGALQTLTFPDSNPATGNITALFRATIRP